MSDTCLLIPVLNEEAALPTLIANIAALDPQPAEIVLVDGGSADRTVELARQAGWRVVSSAQGRGVQINTGVAAAQARNVCILHADTVPPLDMVAVIEDVLADPKTALASFTPIIKGEKTRWGTTAHNWAKTWYAPLLFRPRLFFRGARLLFGDHAMFFRKADFLQTGGCDPSAKVMEEADLCICMAELGRVRMVPRFIETSDRRIAEWGPLKANWIYLKVGLLWAMGSRQRLERHYPDVR
ncbi:glycosyltransferase [Aurantiacibacter rhizosphaerae]|uniref:Glycosyltransferase n=1 Tax=Aurantiacibacter rhizosphaerae TaxID=2691582 RepID=A0A844XBS9_9SPHN|nr:glycosyltransferase [Aurantiacibacter rhizosphaerae]MWV27094.1 glycosyltransferase [Aurantiacibacter rhizosphaerae]